MKISPFLLSFWLLISPVLIYSDTWKPVPPAQVPGSGTPGSVIYSSYSPSLGKYLVTWRSSTSQPTYDIFDGTSWGSPTAIPTAFLPASGIFSAWSPTLNIFLVTWTDTTATARYITFDGTSWSASAAIPGAGLGGFSIFSSFGRGVFLVTWRGITGFPRYATFNGTTWGPAANIPGSTTVAANSAILSSYNSALGKFVVTWRDATNFPFYALFDGTTWTIPVAIPGSGTVSAAPVFAVPTSYSSISGETMAVWTGAAGGPFYALYNGTWTTPTAIPVTPATTGSIVFASFDSFSQKFLATWDGAASSRPIYATFDGATWSTPMVIPGAATFSGASFSSAAPNQFLVTWLGNPPLRVIYSTLTATLPPPLVTVVGIASENRSVLQRELFNIIRWTAPTGVPWTPAVYLIYRNATLTELAGSVPASGPLEFVDHNLQRGVLYTYYVVAVDTMSEIHFVGSVAVRAGG